jgi:hypothetical protein
MCIHSGHETLRNALDRYEDGDGHALRDLIDRGVLSTATSKDVLDGYVPIYIYIFVCKLYTIYVSKFYLLNSSMHIYIYTYIHIHIHLQI